MASKDQGRYFGLVAPDDKDLGPLTLLPGKWANAPCLNGRGWNMIALPFAKPRSRLDYRLLMNQYNEVLEFTLVDKGVPNRGIRKAAISVNTDQTVVTLDYQQAITQIAADDRPKSTLAGGPKLPIHHEPGLWLYMKDRRTNGLDVARLGSIPHGDAVLALGKSRRSSGAPTIPVVNGRPIGVSQNLNSRYLSPYKHFQNNPFKGLFRPVDPSELLRRANVGVNIARTTTLDVDTTVQNAGIRNIPFIVKQANAAEMTSTFWIQELVEKDDYGDPKLRLQYLQVVMLDFFKRRDGEPGLIRWPHVSINTMEKVV